MALGFHTAAEAGAAGGYLSRCARHGIKLNRWACFHGCCVSWSLSSICTNLQKKIPRCKCSGEYFAQKVQECALSAGPSKKAPIK